MNRRQKSHKAGVKCAICSHHKPSGQLHIRWDPMFYVFSKIIFSFRICLSVSLSLSLSVSLSLSLSLSLSVCVCVSIGMCMHAFKFSIRLSTTFLIVEILYFMVWSSSLLEPIVSKSSYDTRLQYRDIRHICWFYSVLYKKETLSDW